MVDKLNYHDHDDEDDDYDYNHGDDHDDDHDVGGGDSGGDGDGDDTFKHKLLSNFSSSNDLCFKYVANQFMSKVLGVSIIWPTCQDLNMRKIIFVSMY